MHTCDFPQERVDKKRLERLVFMDKNKGTRSERLAGAMENGDGQSGRKR